MQREKPAIVASINNTSTAGCMESSQRIAKSTLESDTEMVIRVVCGWCGRLLRDSDQPGALTSHGLCPRCAQVLEGRTAERLGDDAAAALEHRVNVLMCQIYQTRQMLLGMQQRVGTNAELLARVGQALVSIRQQERVVADIQRDISSAQV
jgi:hypothetical protein